MYILLSNFGLTFAHFAKFVTKQKLRQSNL